MGIYSYSTRRHAGLSGVKSVEQLQRQFTDRRSGPAFTVVARQEPQRTDDLSPLQTIALLRMADSTMCRGVAINMLGEVQDKPSRFDYARLVALKMAKAPCEGECWHKTTVHGETEARVIARIEARKRDIHLMIDNGNYGAQAGFSCTCGKWSASIQRGTYTNSNASLRFSQHLARVEEARDRQRDGTG